MSKCDCWRVRASYYYGNVYVCYGTKEIEECSCGGDRKNCDFYPEVREKAKEEELSDWIWDTGNKYECSHCGAKTKVDESRGLPLYKFCPYCGKKMKV